MAHENVVVSLFHVRFSFTLEDTYVINDLSFLVCINNIRKNCGACFDEPSDSSSVLLNYKIGLGKCYDRLNLDHMFIRKRK